MKNFIRIAILAVAVFTLAAIPAKAGKKNGKAAVTFESYRMELGNVPEKGGPVSCEFAFTNTGDANLLIIDAKATCGCTRPEYPKKPVEPGKSGKVKVTYNPAGRPGPIDRTVTITTNGKPKKVRLHIVGNVIPGKK